MKSEITISELAKLMNVSVHQIRYFEEKGVLHPAYIDHNQYRMYSMDQIYQLAHIQLLRKLGVPVQSIKDCMASYSADQYRKLLQHSLREVDKELQRLNELRQYIEKVLQEQQIFSSEFNHYQIKRRETSFLARWIEMDSGTKLNAKLLAEQTKRVANLFESDIHYIYDSSDDSSVITLYLETQAPGDMVLPGGEYLSTQRLAREDDELDDLIEQFYDYAAVHSYVISGPLILIERSYLSLFSSNDLHYELLAAIESDEKSEKK